MMRWPRYTSGAGNLCYLGTPMATSGISPAKMLVARNDGHAPDDRPWGRGAGALLQWTGGQPIFGVYRSEALGKREISGRARVSG
jgi:hypothetical protein